MYAHMYMHKQAKAMPKATANAKAKAKATAAAEAEAAAEARKPASRGRGPRGPRVPGARVPWAKKRPPGGKTNSRTTLSTNMLFENTIKGRKSCSF